MKTTWTLLLLSFLLSPTIFGQITIPAERFTKLIDAPFREVLYETNLDIDPQLQTIIAATGANQVWDFSNLNFVDSTVTGTHVSAVAADDPILNDPNFSGSAYTWRDTVFPHPDAVFQDTFISVRYGNFDNGNYTVRAALSIGDIDQDGNIDTFRQWFSPPTLQITFPIEEHSQWFDSTTINQNLMGVPFMSAITLDSSWVQGWGTLITPRGSVEALRVFHKNINRIPGLPGEEVGQELQFFTFDGVLSASIVIEDGRAFFAVSDTGPTSPTSTTEPGGSQQAFQLEGIHPNPVGTATSIEFSLQKAGQVRLQLRDLNGRLAQQIAIQQFPAGSHQIPWEKPASLVPGIYLLEMAHQGQRTTKRLVIH